VKSSPAVKQPLPLGLHMVHCIVLSHRYAAGHGFEHGNGQLLGVRRQGEQVKFNQAADGVGALWRARTAQKAWMRRAIFFSGRKPATVPIVSCAWFVWARARF